MGIREARVWHVAAALVSLLVVALLLLRLSDAAFTATTANASNQFAAGTVTLTDDDSATAMFSVTNMAPGASQTRCIKVSYSGSLNANVKLYGSITGGTGLGPYLNLTVYRGSGGAFGNCTGFTSTETVYTGTLSGFTGTYTSFGTGAGSWAPVGGAPVDDMTYQFVASVQSDNAAQGLTTTATFTWEAQNS